MQLLIFDTECNKKLMKRIPNKHYILGNIPDHVW